MLNLRFFYTIKKSHLNGAKNVHCDVAEIKIGTVFNIDLEFETAPIQKRMAAYGLDIFVLVVYLYVMKFILYEFLQLRNGAHTGLDTIVVSLPMLFYPLLCEMYFHGQTLGKRLMHIRVISMNGGEPELSQYLIRWATRFFEWPFLFGYIAYSKINLMVYLFITLMLGIFVVIIIAMTDRNQRLGDLAAGTVVVNARTSLNINDTIFMNVQSPGYQVVFPEVMRLSDRDINTIQSVLKQSYKYGDEIAGKVSARVQEVLHITTKLPPQEFLEKLMEDYNYLATQE